MSTSRMARGLRIFPYGRNVAAVVSAVMKKDRQDAAQKLRLVVRIGDPFHGGGGGGGRAGPQSLPPPVVASQRRLRSRPPPCPRSLRRVRRLVLLARANHPWASPPRFERCPPRRALTRRGARVADFDTDINVSDYFGGKFF
jgi:hypothetical protein